MRGTVKVKPKYHSDPVSGSDVNIALRLALEYHNINVKVYKTLERTQAGLSGSAPVPRILLVGIGSDTVLIGYAINKCFIILTDKCQFKCVSVQVTVFMSKHCVTVSDPRCSTAGNIASSPASPFEPPPPPSPLPPSVSVVTLTQYALVRTEQFRFQPLYNAGARSFFKRRTKTLLTI